MVGLAVHARGFEKRLVRQENGAAGPSQRSFDALPGSSVHSMKRCGWYKYGGESMHGSRTITILPILFICFLDLAQAEEPAPPALETVTFHGIRAMQRFEPDGMSLSQTYCYLDSFVDKALSQEKLEWLQRDFDLMRK